MTIPIVRADLPAGFAKDGVSGFLVRNAALVVEQFPNTGVIPLDALGILRGGDRLAGGDVDHGVEIFTEFHGRRYDMDGWELSNLGQI